MFVEMFVVEIVGMAEIAAFVGLAGFHFKSSCSLIFQ